MNTIYILGKKGFRIQVSRQLGKTARACLPGEMIDIDPVTEGQLYWLPDSLSCTQLKRRIGAAIVLKYRLRFLSPDQFYTRDIKDQPRESDQDHELTREFLAKMITFGKSPQQAA